MTLIHNCGLRIADCGFGRSAIRNSHSAIRVLALAAAALASAAPAARADSIWARATSRGAAPRVYEDDTARRVGDILTIIVNERSVVDHETKRANDKKSDRSITSAGTVHLRTLPQWWGQKANDTFTLPDIKADSKASSKFEGNADFESERSLSDRITVTVHDVLPNGNLVVLGRRQRHVEGDLQMVCVSGIVRPSDITFANTVVSEQVAEFHMVTVVKGPETQFTKPGWLGRILNFLSPW